MTAVTVTAFAEESLDALVWRAIGQGPGAVELVLAANPGIAATSAALVAGAIVTIPDIAATPATVDLVNLWD